MLSSDWSGGPDAAAHARTIDRIALPPCASACSVHCVRKKRAIGIGLERRHKGDAIVLKGPEQRLPAEYPDSWV
jgi:hypothetical protein